MVPLMFRRRWKWFGELISDEGFSLKYANRSVRYKDERGVFEFGWEDGFLFPHSNQIAGEAVSLSESELNEILQRVMRGFEAEGHAVRLYAPTQRS